MNTHPIMDELRAERRARGITLSELSHRSGYPYNSICRWEKGVRLPYLQTAVDLANAMGFELKLERKGP